MPHLAYLAATNAFVLVRLLTMSERTLVVVISTARSERPCVTIWMVDRPASKPPLLIPH
jgi:hypothetical protein